MLVPPIVTQRLELVLMPAAFMRASLSGELTRAQALLDVTLPADWPGPAEHVLRLRVAQIARDSLSEPWLLRAIVLRQAGRPVVGRIGFHAPPDAHGSVEVGYAIEPDFRRRGYASEALAALLGWAAREPGVGRFIASVSPTNVASLALVRTFGFRQVGTEWDDLDGEELVFERVLGPDAPFEPPSQAH